MRQEYSIGELSARTGVKVPTIRYYEEIGLIEAPARTEGNQRRYDRAALERLRFIANARQMGFSMGSLRSMLGVTRHREAPCAEVDAQVTAHLREVDDRIAQLARLRADLAGMLSDGHHGTVGECRVVEVLEEANSE